MANLDCLLCCTFGNSLAPALVAPHAANSLDLGEGYESDLIDRHCKVSNTKFWQSFRYQKRLLTAC